jgi:hypothetical protein
VQVAADRPVDHHSFIGFGWPSRCSSARSGKPTASR